MNAAELALKALHRHGRDMTDDHPIESFEGIRADITQRLRDGAGSRHSACHLPVVVTRDADARVMVLRDYDPASRTLRFHTDSRSPKCELIGDGAPIGVLFYDKQAKIQMRCRGEGRIEKSGSVADTAWHASTQFARRCYVGEAPGSAADGPSSGLPDWAEGLQPTEDQVAPYRANFAVLLVQLAEVDWLFLANSGHRRAMIDLISGEGRWITP